MTIIHGCCDKQTGLMFTWSCGWFQLSHLIRIWICQLKFSHYFILNIDIDRVFCGIFLGHLVPWSSVGCHTMLVSNYWHHVTSQKSKGLSHFCAFLCHAAVGCVVIAVELSVSIFRVEVSIGWKCLGYIGVWPPGIQQDRWKEQMSSLGQEVI